MKAGGEEGDGEVAPDELNEAFLAVKRESN
jgi:hypothetical protein